MENSNISNVRRFGILQHFFNFMLIPMNWVLGKETESVPKDIQPINNHLNCSTNEKEFKSSKVDSVNEIHYCYVKIIVYQNSESVKEKEEKQPTSLNIKNKNNASPKSINTNKWNGYSKLKVYSPYKNNRSTEKKKKQGISTLEELPKVQPPFSSKSTRPENRSTTSEINSSSSNIEPSNFIMNGVPTTSSSFDPKRFSLLDPEWKSFIERITSNPPIQNADINGVESTTTTFQNTFSTGTTPCLHQKKNNLSLSKTMFNEQLSTVPNQFLEKKSTPCSHRHLRCFFDVDKSSQFGSSFQQHSSTYNTSTQSNNSSKKRSLEFERFPLVENGQSPKREKN